MDNGKQGSADKLLRFQLSELARRERVSAIVAIPAAMTIAWMHWGWVSAPKDLIWLAYMLVILIARFWTTYVATSHFTTHDKLRRWLYLKSSLSALYGVGWGAQLFLLDTGDLDFLLIFKLAALAAAMGIAVNALSVLLQVYASFVFPVIIFVTTFFFTNTPYLPSNERNYVLLGTLIYLTLLMVAAKKNSELTASALEKDNERELALAQATSAEENRRTSEDRLRLLLDSTSEGIYGVDTEGICTFVNKSFLNMLGYESEDQVVGKAIHPLIHHTYPDGRPYPKEACHVRLSTIEGKTTYVDGEVHWRADGSSFPVEYRSHPMYNEGQLIGAVVSFSDITDRKHSETALKESEERLRLALSAAHQGWFDLDLAGNTLNVSPEFARMLGYEPDQFDSSRADWLMNTHPEDHPALTFALENSLKESQPFVMEYRYKTRSGNWLWLRSIGQAVQWNASGQASRMIGIHTDITQAKQYEQQLRHIAHHDAITGLPNRVLLADRLKQAMAQARRRGNRLAVAYLDIDGFKAVNDTHGHAIGDKLLALFAIRVKEVLRDGDTLARLGGDEFVAVLIDLPDVDASMPMLSRILETASQPVEVGELRLNVSVSIGVTFYPQPDDLDPDQLLRQADQAMYQAKQAGKNRFEFYEMQPNSTQASATA